MYSSGRIDLTPRRALAHDWAGGSLPVRASAALFASVGLTLTFCVGWPSGDANAFEVASDSGGNRVYLVVSHRDVNFPLDNVFVGLDSSPPEASCGDQQPLDLRRSR